MKNRIVFFFFLLIAIQIFPQDSSQTFLSLKSTGVEDFLKTNPTYDGRGTIIFILDTGVDMGIEGLQKTSTNETKVIDVRDFTGQGDVKLTEAELETENGITVAKDEQQKLSVKGINKLELKADDNKYFIGNFNEERFRNSNAGIKDLNGNGKEDDNFVVVVFRTAIAGDTNWVAYFDSNADGDLSDEKPIRNYNEHQDTFQILNPKQIPYLTFAVNIFPDKKLISVFFDDGGHGSHCAGIAAGYKIGSQNLNGVAPGAKVIALKLGDNTNSGGATVTGSMKKAYLYADKISKERKEPCIVSMSYGVGSVIEGNAEMELFLDDLLKKNPYLYVCVSNGNNGPGISTTGLPASARYVLSSGAVLAEEVGRDDYGSSVKENIILHFSSRGGEVAKPDVCSPGAATSTVTNWSGGDRMWGTSMASPYSAGLVSLMLSAAKQKYPDVKIPSQLLFKAIKYGATKMDGYNILDQGAGYINAPNAFVMIEKFLKNKENEKFQDYKVSSFAPNMPKGKAQNLYIRNGSTLSDNDVFRFNVSRVNPDAKEKFYRIYNLESNNDWLIPIQKKTYIRNSQNATVNVKFDKNKMKEPGLYTGKITAYRDDKSKFPEFECIASVVIPYEFNSSNNYMMSWNNEKLMPGRHKRYFLNVPPGAGVITIKVSSEKTNYTNVVYRLFNPDGVNVFTSPSLNADKEENSIINNNSDLKPGVYELVVHGHFLATGQSTYNLSVEFGGVKAEDQNVVIQHTIGKMNVFNYFNQIKNYDLSGNLLGYQKEFTVSFSNSDKFVYSFFIRKDEESKKFSISMSKEDFNKYTDFSVLIFDEKGNAIEKDGLDYPDGSIEIANTFENADSTKLNLVIVPAFVDFLQDAKVKIVESTYLKNSISFPVQNEMTNKVELYPTIEKTIDCFIPKPGFYFPNDSKPFGIIYFKSPKADKQEFEIPFLLNVEGDNK
ncbi:MAG: S8 family serine peptidase [Ignavibacteriales bacterium]|nr:S8 family serine peptidase [Ignavibacteriales bacterium]